MKVVLLLLSIALPDILATNDHARFEWTDCGDNVADQCMMVVFPADNMVDVALLNYVEGEITVLSGHLKDDDSISVAVSVEEHQLEVNILTDIFISFNSFSFFWLSSIFTSLKFIFICPDHHAQPS